MTYEDTIDRAVIHDSIVLPDRGEPCEHCGSTRAHEEHCPFITGLWPISYLEESEGATFTFVCDACDKEHEARFACPRCDRYFDDDDCYRIVDSETQLVATYVLAPRDGVGICTDCAGLQSEALRKMLGGA